VRESTPFRAGRDERDEQRLERANDHRGHVRGRHVELRAAMIVLDAATLDVHAWAEVPFPIPLGFHGSFFR
jgi:hypothetical protein